MGFLAGVEGIVDGLLDRGQQGSTGIVETEKMAILGEELGDGDFPLL